MHVSGCNTQPLICCLCLAEKQHYFCSYVATFPLLSHSDTLGLPVIACHLNIGLWQAILLCNNETCCIILCDIGMQAGPLNRTPLPPTCSYAFRKCTLSPPAIIAVGMLL